MRGALPPGPPIIFGGGGGKLAPPPDPPVRIYIVGTSQSQKASHWGFIIFCRTEGGYVHQAWEGLGGRVSANSMRRKGRTHGSCFAEEVRARIVDMIHARVLRSVH